MMKMETGLIKIKDVYFKKKRAFIVRNNRNCYGEIKKCLNCKSKFFAQKWSNGKCAYFCSCICLGKYRSKERNPHWKGGQTFTHKGYKTIRNVNHPFNNNGYVLEHRFVMEKLIGRYLRKDEDVHHINGIKNDNRIINLKLMKHGEHTTITNNNRWGKINGK